jgi:ligand-binding SRPBCC domain-containing protein
MCFQRPVSEIFSFFIQPANLVLVSPPELKLRVVDGPDRLSLGARLTLTGRRWGVSQRVVSEVTTFDPNRRFVDSQVLGPFQKWVHTHTFEEIPGGARVHDAIEYEPPGGLLGLVVTAGTLARNLEWIFAYRVQKLRELLGP